MSPSEIKDVPCYTINITITVIESEDTHDEMVLFGVGSFLAEMASP